MFESQLGVSGHDEREFVSLSAARSLVEIIMSSRVGEDHTLLPLEEERVRTGIPNGPMMLPDGTYLRHDMVLPPIERTYEPHPEGGKVCRTYGYSASSALYDGIVESKAKSLSLEETRTVAAGKANLEHTITAHGGLAYYFDRGQQEDAYHIDNKTEAAQIDDRLSSYLRIYVAGGLQALGIAQSVIGRGAEFAYAKVWAPQAALGVQTIRHDAPIFRVNTLRQLRSTLDALRAMAADGSLPTARNHASPLGIPAAGLPGVTVVQPRYGSFNGDMADFFAGPITEACNHPELALRAGDVVTSDWLDAAARKVRAIAQRDAEAAGLHPQSHALLREQDIDIVMDALRS